MPGLSRRHLLAGALACTACAGRRPAPPLAQLYANEGLRDQPPVVLIPGAFGSQLRRRSTGEEIWPRSNLSLLLSSYPDIEVDIHPESLEALTDDIEAFDIFRQGLGQDFYGAVLDMMENVGGYTRKRIGDAVEPGQRNYYVYAYDWRIDNLAAVQGLDNLIEQIAEAYGDPGLRVDVIAHSNGGLLARYYARYGVRDVLTDLPSAAAENGSHRIDRLLLVGTPNLGTLQPVLSHVRGEEIGLRHIPADVVATCSGAPQLMPHPDLVWLVNLKGEPINLDLYDLETWRALGWSIFSPFAKRGIMRRHGGRKGLDAHLSVLEAYLAKHLQRGRLFHQSLSGPPQADEPRPYVFGADCTPTAARLVLDLASGGYRAYERVEQIPASIAGTDYQAMIHDPGDGVVTRSSLMGRAPRGERVDAESLEIVNSVFLCEAHQYLTSNPTFQDNLLFTLLRLDQL